ncbi:MAG: VOC family protein [Burkholderiaceae bacterium]
MSSHPQLTHMGLYTADVPAMERFYSEVIGLIVTDRGRSARLGDVELVFMSANPEVHHQIALVGVKEKKGPSCVNQIAFRVRTLSELKAVHQKMVSAGVGEVMPINHGCAWSVYGFDPDGNGIEIYIDTPWYVTQPHGRPLDLSLSDEEIERSTEAAVRADPSFRSLADWSASIARQL